MTNTQGIAPDRTSPRRPRSLHSEILPGLWMGGTRDEDVLGVMARRERDEGRYVAPAWEYPTITTSDFDAVVTLYHCARPVGLGVEELRWGIIDNHEDPHGGFDPDVDTLMEIVNWAHRRWTRGDKVLIRCQAGLNRSGLVTALVLMQGGRYTPAEAIRMIRQRRAMSCLFNEHFVTWLLTGGDQR